MIYKLIVNAAFLVIGYTIGKQVGLNERARNTNAQAGTTRTQATQKRTPG
jgi:hypothetical protein